jgi:glycosyltransferase involved in cell wall biosynthesis
MEDCDFARVYDSFKQPSIDSLFAKVHKTVRRQKTLKGKLQSTGQTISGLLPCITDDYSRLRYSLYFLQNILNDAREKTSYGDINPIVRSAVQEMYCSAGLRNGKSAEKLLREPHDLPGYTAVLRSIAGSRAQVSVQGLLEQIGHSDYVDSLIGDIFMLQPHRWEFQEVEECFRPKILDGSIKPKIQIQLLDFAAYRKMHLLAEGEIEGLFQRWEGNVQGTLALLRYIGECGLLNLTQLLHRKLQRSNHQPLVVTFGIIDVLGQIGYEQSLQPLKKLRDDAAGFNGERHSSLLQEYIDLTTREIRQGKWKPEKMKKGGMSLAQCIFYGDVDLQGISGGGGIATLLHELGNQLAHSVTWDRVFSFVLFPLVEGTRPRPLIQHLGNSRHCVIRVPVSFPQEDHPKQFMSHEYEILRGLHRALEMHRIDPDILHVRYSDNASKAVMMLSTGLDKKLVFTLTADPHRSFVDRRGNMRLMTEVEVLLNLNKVYIADLLVEKADGIVLIGQGRKNDQIIPYFPKLWLDEETRFKPIQVIPEGIQLNVRLRGDESYGHYCDLISDHNGTHRVNPPYLDRPVILNVGRLNPVKNQHMLVRAWARSKINEMYNLMLIGGNLKRPDAA